MSGSDLPRTSVPSSVGGVTPSPETPQIIGSRVRLPWTIQPGRIVDAVFGGTPALLLFAVVAHDRGPGMPPAYQHIPWRFLCYSAQDECYVSVCSDDALLAEALRLNAKYPIRDRGVAYRFAPSWRLH